VSAAYYALFHLLVDEGALRLIPNAPEQLRARACRAFAHKDMKNACEQIARSSSLLIGLVVPPIEPEIKLVAETFIELQQQRHLADYDPLQSFTRLKVLGIIDQADSAVSAWANIRNAPNANVFLTSLLLNNRWNK
jgi:hypothetical protein